MVNINENGPVFSIVIPTYNRANVISRTIVSVMKQTYQSFEIIVVDDGSTDETHKIILSMDDGRIIYKYQMNQGAQVARNTGLHMARGKYISFLDSDDEWDPSFLYETLKLFEKDLTIGCVYCLMGSIDSLGKVYPLFKSQLHGDIYREALEQGYITAPSSLVVKKTCFNEIGEWDVSFRACQDDDICFRLAKKFKFALIPNTLCIINSNYSGCGNRISASAVRVANGWWQLWNKYENEVLQYCGKKTMGKHYLNCARYFAKANDVSMQDEALSRALKLFDFQTECDCFLKDILQNRLYCYGAGEYALIIAKYLLMHHYQIKAFLVSDGNEKMDSILGIPVIYISTLNDKDDFSVLLATSKMFHDDIKATLKSLEINNVYIVSEEYYSWMYTYVKKNSIDGSRKNNIYEGNQI